MEEVALKTMRKDCSFPGARRYFVSGIVQQGVRIPNREHDLEGSGLGHPVFNPYFRKIEDNLAIL